MKVGFKKLAFTIGALLISLAINSLAVAQTNNQNVTANADNLIAGERNGQPVEQLAGHMQFWQGSLSGTADTAVRYTKINRLDLIGHVAIHQDTLSLYAPLVIYNGDTHIGHAENGVKLLDRDATLTADNGDYNMDSQVANFHHDVKIVQGKTTSYANELTYFRTTQTSILTGNVRVLSDSGSLTSDKATYTQATGETIAEGNVHLGNDSLRLSSDWFYNSKPLGLTYTRGRVKVEDLKNHTVIYGDTLARFAETSYSIVPKNPLLLSIDSSTALDSVTGELLTKFDTMFVKSRTMEIYQGDSLRFVASDSVRLMRTGFSATGGKMDYSEARNVLTISRDPRQHLWYDSTEIDADSVALLTKQRHVNRVFAVGHAFATSPLSELPNSGRVDQLSGESMMLLVNRDTARYLLDMSDALSMYFLVRENKADGVNRASGDTIRIDFKKKSASRLAIISGTEGEYFPERFVTGRAAAFRLTGFERHDPLRPRREEFQVPWELPPAMAPSPSPSSPAAVPKAVVVPKATAVPKKKRNS